MKVDAKLFRSKIARRIFILFVSCALFPILCISIISFVRVTEQLKDQSYRLLKQSITGYADSIYGRLRFLDAELQFIGSSFKSTLNDSDHIHRIVLNKSWKPHFRSIVFFKPEKRNPPIYKAIDDVEMPSRTQIQDIIRTGMTAIFWVQHPKSLTQIMMVEMMDKKDRVLWLIQK